MRKEGGKVKRRGLGETVERGVGTFVGADVTKLGERGPAGGKKSERNKGEEGSKENNLYLRTTQL